jgi:hypothetical protein
MSAADELSFRRLEDRELPLLDGLLAMAVVDDPASECWGVAPGVMPRNAGEIWGMFIRDGLAGALWFRDPQRGVAEVAALVLPRKRWKMGLMTWMTGEIAKEAKRRGAVELLARLDPCSEALAEEMEFALFTGPDPTEDNYPNGEWRRTLEIPTGDEA